MSDSYTGKLISKLYSVTDYDKIMELIEEIEELSDPVFVVPILDAYKTHQKKFYSHYFLSALNLINSPDITGYVVEILKEPVSKKDYYYLIKILLHRDYFDGDIAQQGVKMILEDLKDVDEWDLETFVPYFKKSGLLMELAGVLEQIFIKDDLKKEVRTNALQEWIKLEPRKRMEHIISNFDFFVKNESLLCVLSKVIIKWKESNLVTKIISSIRQTNNVDAVRILDLYEKKKNAINTKKQEVQQSEIKKDFSNSDIIERIIKKRETINTLATSKDTIGIDLFPANEKLIFQARAATDLSTLRDHCVNLRGIIQDIDKQNLSHGLDVETIKSLLPNTAPQDYKKSLIVLYLFLKSRSFLIESDLAGMQPLNKLLNLLGAHPEDNAELIKILQSSGCYELYISENWIQLHQFILTKYEESLDKLIEVFSA